jgi:hypothetical protein
MLRELKWGMLYDFMNPVFRELIDSMFEKGYKTEEVPLLNLSIGQGLNLTSDCIVTLDLLKMHPVVSKSLIPFFTSDDGAPFNLVSTKNFIVDKSKLSNSERKELKSLGIKAFDPASTKKVIPILIMPRGIGRHFCAINNASAFSASDVDIYSSSKIERKPLLNLWLFLNSSIAWLIREVSGRKNLGGGMLKAEAIDLKYFPIYYEFPDLNSIESLFQKLKNRSALSPLEEIETSEHEQIDKIVFDYLNLDSVKRKSIVDSLKSKIADREKKATT